MIIFTNLLQAVFIKAFILCTVKPKVFFKVSSAELQAWGREFDTMTLTESAYFNDCVLP